MMAGTRKKRLYFNNTIEITEEESVRLEVLATVTEDLLGCNAMQLRRYLRTLLCPKGGGSSLLRNVGKHISGYVASHPRTQ
jgi:hypothetical protein